MKRRRKADTARPSATARRFEELAQAGRAILVGTGNIGSRLAVELPLVGIRRLVLIDPDRVSSRNLICCGVFGPGDIGQHKVRVLAGRLKERYADLEVTPFARTVNAVGLAYLRDATPGMLVGAVDSRRARLELAEAAMLLGMPLVDAAIASSPQTAMARVQVTWPAVTPVDPLDAWSAADWALLEQRLACSAADGARADRPVAGAVSGALAASLAAEQVRRLLSADGSDLGREVRVDLESKSVIVYALPRHGLSPLDPAYAIARPPAHSQAATLTALVAEAEHALGPGAEVILNRPFSCRFACTRCGRVDSASGPVDGRACQACGHRLVPVNPVESLSRATVESWPDVPVERLGPDRDLLRAAGRDGSRHIWLEYGKERRS